jgi:hypothetical protein
MRITCRTLLISASAVCVAVLPIRWAAAQGKSDAQRAKLPAAVAKAIEDNRAGAEIDKLDIEKEDGITFYDIEFKGNQGEMDVLEDGTVLDVATIIEMKDLPEAVAAVIQNVARGRTIKQLSKSEVRAKIEKEGGKGRLSRLSAPEYVYEAEFARGEVEVAADGTILKGPKGPAKP